MGSAYSQVLEDAKENEGTLVLEGAKLKSKELAGLVSRLSQALPELEALEVRSSKLKALPTNVAELAALRALRLVDNKLSSLPGELAACCRLEELDLSRNAFTQVPDQVREVASLKTLDMTGNEATAFPAAQHSKHYHSLERLVLAQNHFSSFPNNVCALIGLTHLNLNENGLTNLPAAELARLVNLRELHVRGNQISEIPPTIERLKQLVRLDISENQIRALPPQIQELHALLYLEAQHNRIYVFSQELCRVTSLVTLKLNDNNIKELPRAVSRLTCLTELYLRENKIESFPAEIGQLSSLQKLYAEYNLLASLPAEIAQLKRLVVLILHHNQLTELPECLTEMTHLLRLSLNDNPLPKETLELIEAEGALAILNKDDPDRGSSSSQKFASLKRKTMRRDTLMAPKARKVAAAGGSLTRKITVSAMREMQNAEEAAVAGKDGKKAAASPVTSPAVPSFSKFKFAFDSLLEEADFSKQKKTVLKKMPDNEKWKLLTQYKGSTLDMLRNQPAAKSDRRSKRSSQTKAPQDYPALIREGRLNKNTWDRLTQSLKTNQGGWVSQFVEAGGIQALATFMKTTTAKSSESKRDQDLLLDCLEIMGLLLQVSMKSVLTASGAIVAIALCLGSDSARNRAKAVELLEGVCHDEIHIGSEIVLEAINAYTRETGEEFRFFPLVTVLEDPRIANETKALCLSLINSLVDSVPGLEQRFAMRTEFLSMGFQGLLQQLRQASSPLLDIERIHFEEETAADLGDMRCKFSTQAVVKQMTGTADGSQLAIAVITDEVSDSLRMPLDCNRTAGDLCAAVEKAHAIASPRRYSLFVPPGEAGEEGVWLDASRTLASYGLANDRLAVLEYRLAPFRVTLRLPDDSTVEEALDPALTCEETVAELVTRHGLVARGDYALFLSGTSPVRLEDAQLLSSTPLAIEKNRKRLELRQRPLRIKVILAKDTWQLMEFNPSMKIGRVFDQIASRVGSAVNVASYGLVLEGEHTNPVALDNAKPLSAYEFNDKCQLKFALRAVKKEETEEDDEECSIWEELEDTEDTITYEEGKERCIENIETATLNKLVLKATSPDEYDPNFVNVFVMMLHAFASEERLWAKLLERFDVPDSFPSKVRQKIQMRVCVFIKNWVDHELGDRTRQAIGAFVEEIKGQAAFEMLAMGIQSRLAAPKGAEIHISSVSKPKPLLPKNILTSNLSLFDVEELEVARQLTLSSFAIYSRLKAKEFFKNSWSKDQYKHLSPNVLAMIDHYNDVSQWLCSCIVSQPRVRTRAKLLTRIVAIADKLRALNNFHLLSAVISAINNSAVQRLKYTFARLSKRSQALLSELEDVMSMESSFGNYRNALANASPPCIPFIGVYLTDLTFINDGNPDKVGRRINYIKYKYSYSVISTIQAYQTTPYNLVRLDIIEQLMSNSSILTDNEVYALSLKIEPRGATRASIM